MFNKKSILITGGTGSFGKYFSNYVVKNYPKVKKIVILSRDEFKQFKMKESIEKKYLKKFRFLIGDVRDKDRLIFAFRDIDYIIHAAALKQVPVAEYNPFEFIKTNINGAQNVIEASLLNNVTKVVALSTDKASSPINLYGATKLCSDKLFTTANNIKGKNAIIFSVVRYGNVMGSRGSIIPKFIEQKKSGVFTITDKGMTRFNISLMDSVKLVIEAIYSSKLGGEIFIPKMPSYRICDLAKSISKECKLSIIGIRPGEKLHEELISVNDSKNTLSFKNFFLILPNLNSSNRKNYLTKYGNNFVPENFHYNSKDNKDFLNVTQLRNILKKNFIF